jgi:hypothetical protein
MEVNRAPALRSSEIEARPMASAAGASIQVLDDPDV